jgi:hypothetical protein
MRRAVQGEWFRDGTGDLLSDPAAQIFYNTLIDKDKFITI